MPTLPTRALQVARIRPLAGLARVRSAILAVIDVYSEALNQAQEVQKRYPFADE